MRRIGKRMEPEPRLRWPSADHIQWTLDMAQNPLPFRRGRVIRYRNHEEANAHMDQVLAEALARKGLVAAGDGENGET